MLWRMDRRSFFRTMVGGVAASAAVRTWPFRVYSFPSQIVIPTTERLLQEINRAFLKFLEDNPTAWQWHDYLIRASINARSRGSHGFSL